MLFDTIIFCIAWKGVCVGLSEVMASAGKSQLMTFMTELIPTIRPALCDRYVYFNLLTNFWIFLYCTILYLDGYLYSEPAVRESAGLAFSTLYKVVLFTLCLIFCVQAFASGIWH
jgi:hypothetical protein